MSAKTTSFIVSHKQARMALILLGKPDVRLPRRGNVIHVVTPTGVAWRFMQLEDGSYDIYLDDKLTAAHAPFAPCNRDQWIPACNGTETPFKARNGMTLWYMWNRVTGDHAYLNTGTDIFLTNEEAQAALGKV